MDTICYESGVVMGTTMTPADARAYVKTFATHTMPGMTWVQFPSGRIEFANMTDEEAVKVAVGLMEIEAEAAARTLQRTKAN